MRAWSRLASAACIAASAVLVVPALAATYFTPAQVLKAFFATEKKVTYRKITLPESTRAAIAKKLGVSPASVRAEWTIYFGETEADGQVKRSGYAILDSEKGMHEPIDFAVRFSPTGAVERIEIMEYREAYGDEVRRDSYKNQFRGKTSRDPITAGEDIDIISGASISSKSVARGVKRDVLVLEAALQSGGL